MTSPQAFRLQLNCISRTAGISQDFCTELGVEDKKKKKGDVRKREEEEVEGFSDDDTEMKKVPWIEYSLRNDEVLERGW